MKKVILTAVFAFATVSTFANATIIPTETQTVLVQDGFKEVTLEALPDAVKQAVLKDYADAKIVKAHVNDKNQYKLELSAKDATQVVYIEANGTWLQVKQ